MPVNEQAQEALFAGDRSLDAAANFEVGDLVGTIAFFLIEEKVEDTKVALILPNLGRRVLADKIRPTQICCYLAAFEADHRLQPRGAFDRRLYGGLYRLRRGGGLRDRWRGAGGEAN